MQHPTRSLVAAVLFPLCTVTGIASAQEPEAPALPAPSTSLTIGYDSRYVLYGYRLSRHLYKADVYLHLPLSERVSAWAGAWYGYLTDGTYREVDGYAGLDWILSDRVSAGIGYSIFNYLEVPFETSDQAHEFMARVTVAAGPVSLTLREQYDTEAEGSLVRAIAETAHPVTDRLSLAASAEVGYAIEYFIPGDDWNHALFKLAAPVTLTDSVSATAFIARTVALDAIDAFEEDDTYGGLSFTMSF